MLYIVSTPIGHLKDISLRALEVLKDVDVIAAEDTRQTRKLTTHYDIPTPLTSYHEHNEREKAKVLLEKLLAGQKVALVSDAGTPGISDPGFVIVRLAREHGIPVTVIPGPVAFIAALTLSGLPTHRVLFEGFLPPKSAGRRKKLIALEGFEGTVIFYESCHRILKSIQDIGEVWENPEIVVVREITKAFEEVHRGPCDQLSQHFTQHKPRGEFVILIHRVGMDI